MENISKKYRRGQFSFLNRSDSTDIDILNTIGEKIISASNTEAGCLLFCETFQSVDRHVELYINRFTNHKDKVQKLLSFLEECVRVGFLIEESVFLSGLKNIAKTNYKNNFHKEKDKEKINIIGIPTTNRPEALDRALESFIGNVTKYDRTPEFVIADGSKDEFLNKNKEIIIKHSNKYKGIITHLDHDKRIELATKISKGSGVDQDIVSFAVCGDSSSDIHTGALRNSIILYGAGQKILFTDDDVICHPHTVSSDISFNKEINSILLTGSPPRESWFFKDFKSAIEYFPEIDIDYIGEHEKMLGKKVVDIINNIEDSKILLEDEPGNVSDSFINKMSIDVLSDAKIILTYSGSVGDSWMRSHSPTMVSGPDKEYSLWGSSKEDYLSNRKTSFIGRVNDRHAIYTGKNCISINLGIDTGDLIPPFPPLYRSQDAVFGYLVNSCLPKSMSGFIPILIEHLRVESRTPFTDPVRSFTTIGKLIIMSLEVLSPRRDFKSISNYLKDLSNNMINISNEDKSLLKETIYDSASITIDSFTEYCLKLQAYYFDGPDYWHQEINNMTKEIKELSKNIKLAPFFWDVKEWQESQEYAWEQFFLFIKKYGSLLRYWEDVFKYAKTINHSRISND